MFATVKCFGKAQALSVNAARLANIFMASGLGSKTQRLTKRAADVCHVAAQMSSNPNQRFLLVAHAANAIRSAASCKGVLNG